MPNKHCLFDEALKFVEHNELAYILIEDMRCHYREVQQEYSLNALYYFISGFFTAQKSPPMDVMQWLNRFPERAFNLPNTNSLH
ncbi:hypothetical protein RHO15_05960 [Utexia brackfieldae]|uniref:hypothetical protein n=1 Tax=Utexia brackfieldae TaxID=3074108 RepID=UPI00370D3C73